MIETAKQDLINQINRLRSELQEYKKAQANPPTWMNTKALAAAIERIEVELSEFEAQLDASADFENHRLDINRHFFE
jgi:hypothetical protein